MAQADLAIGAGGTTTWERCCLGLPSIIIEVAKNQAGIANEMAKAGAGLKLDQLNSPNFEQSLVEAVTIATNPASLNAMSEAASAICDGNGVNRVISCLYAT
jgi:spore coat polysaccharide biosynthesis predicted glycosyltransferase SpsG